MDNLSVVSFIPRTCPPWETRLFYHGWLEVYWLQCTHVSDYAFLYFIAGRAFSNAFFGAGTGPIYLDEVQCSSSSSQLLECSSRPIGSHDCLHTADAGVGCEGMY